MSRIYILTYYVKEDIRQCLRCVTTKAFNLSTIVFILWIDSAITALVADIKESH